MDKRIVSEEFSSSGQLSAQDVALLAEQGVKSIFCNRPDGEDPGQPDVSEIEEAAKQLGIAFHFLPVVSGQMTNQNVADFASTYATTPKPIHAYCRSGTRSTTLWAISRIQAGEDRDAVVSAAQKAGFDLSGL